jgi:serine/threonine protein kinase
LGPSFLGIVAFPLFRRIIVVGDSSTLFKLLSDHELLKPPHLEETRKVLLSRCADARALAGELVRREWLTPFQANKVLQGKAEELVVGPYRLLERLGEGGMGEVFKARHARMERTVALKVIQKDRLSNATAIERFNREVKAVAQLTHPNIVVAYDYDQDGDIHYFAMEYVEGTDLARLVKEQGPLPVREACDYVRQAALGLQHAHEKGLVHRDIKPANLLVAQNKNHASQAATVKVLDFGLARFASETKTAGHLTQLGQIMGTVDYISPEQAGDPRKADIRSDIYSLGCCLFYALAGKPPFEGPDMVGRIAARVLGDAPALRSVRPQAPAELEQVLAKMLERDARRRYRTPAEVATALAPFGSGQPEGRIRAKKVAVAAAVAASPPHIQLEPVAQEPVFSDILGGTDDEESFIVRQSGRTRRGNWMGIGIVVGILALAGAGAAYWIVNRPKPSSSEKGTPDRIVISDPKPKPPPEPEPKPNPPPEPEPKPKSGTPPNKEPKKEPATQPEPKSVAKVEPPPKPATEPSPVTQPVIAAEPESVPPPKLVAEAAPEPPPKPKTEVAKPKDPRTPVPEGAALAKAEATIKELYKEDYAKVKHSEMSAFAERLLEQAGNTKDDSVLRFVLLREARDVAAKAADATLTLKAIEDLTREYALSGREMKTAALDKASKAAYTPERSGQIVEAILAVLDEALTADNYEEAIRLAKMAENSAYRSNNTSLIASTITRRRDVDSLKDAYEKLKPVAAVLADKPDDPEANLAMGRFLCLLKGDWTEGLPLLVQGGEGKLQDLARKEVGGSEKPEEEAELADGWRDLARTERGAAHMQLVLHALSCYQKALPNLSGVAKKQAEKSAAELEKELPKGRTPEDPAAKFKGRWIILYPNHVVREYVIDAKGNVQNVAEGNWDAKGKIFNTHDMKRSGKIRKENNDFLVSIGDGELERLRLKDGKLLVDHYNPASRYPGQNPNMVAATLRKR